MPVHTGKDSKGCFAQWGNSGKKYRYTCGSDAGRTRAKSKAQAQGRAAHAHGYTGNRGDVPMFQYVTTNLSPLVRQDSMEGKDWVVVPTQMITEGVHNGSDGPIFYPADELAKLPNAWNHKPVVVYHPQVNGEGVSACDPVQLTSRKVGLLLNTKWDDGAKKLGTETWLDPSRMDVVDNRISEAIKNETMMEVSTGLFMDLDPTPGEWNGEEYDVIARNLQPDHLALLPDLKGACSIEDGAGFLRLNQEGDDICIQRKQAKKPKEENLQTIWINKDKGIKATIDTKVFSPSTVQSFLFEKDKWSTDDAEKWAKKHEGTTNVSAIIMNELSYDSIQGLLRGALQSRKEDAWITDVFDDYLIYEEGGKYFKQEYTVEDGNVSFNGLPKAVEREVTYKEVTLLAEANENVSNKKGKPMDKKKIVDALIENERTSWTEEHRESLMKIEESLLVTMQEDAEAAPEAEKSEAEQPKVEESKVEETKAEDKTAPTGNVESSKPLTVEQYVHKAPPEIREALETSIATLSKEKGRLIANIAANPQNTFTKEHLGTMKLEMLQAVSKLANSSPADDESPSGPARPPLYLLQEEVDSQGAAPEPLQLPKMNFAKTDQKAAVA